MSAIVILIGLVLWEVAARAGWIARIFFPPPTTIFLTLVKMGGTSELWASAGMTIYRLTAGVAIGGTAGLLLGLIMGANRLVRVTLNPFVAAMYPLPKLAILPIFMVLLGIGETSKIALVALTAFFPMLINTLAGVQQIDRTYWEVATNYGATGSVMLRRIILPGSLPLALTGLRLAMNGALVVTVAVEMLSARQGLGTQIWMAWQTMRTQELYATLVVIGLLGVVSNQLFNLVSRHLLPWQEKGGFLE